ncbi:kelch domain-containing protein [Acrasis kona]|uniref:Kelch domain-containing protein n=1 Tax=Acrasis kona TaxID=1008807 RepID=A0AAW2ZNZ9_9EUKA
MANSQYTALNSGTNGPVISIAKDGCGNIYLAGTFSQAGGVAVSGLAYYNSNSNSYSAVPNFNISGTTVTAVTTDCTGAVSCGACKVAVAGVFELNTPSGVAKNIAVMVGGNWYPLGDATETAALLGVSTLKFGGSVLYVGGAFANLFRFATLDIAQTGTTVTGVTASWKSSNITFTATMNDVFVGGVIPSVKEIVVVQGAGVYFGGNFLSSVCNYVCVYNLQTSTFQSVGTSDNAIIGIVYGMSFDNSTLLYASGKFDTTKKDAPFVAVTRVAANSVAGDGWRATGYQWSVLQPSGGFAYKIEAIDSRFYAYSTGSYAVTVPGGLAFFYDADVRIPFPFAKNTPNSNYNYLSIVNVPVNGSGVLASNFTLVMLCVILFLFFVQQ